VISEERPRPAPVTFGRSGANYMVVFSFTAPEGWMTSTVMFAMSSEQRDQLIRSFQLAPGYLLRSVHSATMVEEMALNDVLALGAPA
jgi:hypothetical protein